MTSEFSGAFGARWVAEALRLRECERGRLEDATELAAARREAVTLEERIVARARGLAAREGLAAEVAAWRSRSALFASLALLLALLGGIGAALAVAGDGTRPINVVWALGGLLGVHALSLAFWLLGLLLLRGSPGGLGAGWAWLSERFGGGVHAPRAWAGLHRRGGLLRWWFGVATHAGWTLALTGALAGLVLTFLWRGHVFVWESTLLPSDFFVGFVAAAGWLPAQLGFALPAPDAVSASGASALTDEGARRAWASWLLGCVVVYGVLPRAVLWGLCAWRLRAGRAALRLDVGLPGFVELADALSPERERIGVTDAAPDFLLGGRVDAPHAIAGPPALAAIELRGDLPWPPALPQGARDLGVADGRDSRARMLAALAAAPAARLLVACDPRLSPDRGSLAFIAELSRHAGECRVWLAGAGSDERAARWREALAALGLGAEAVMADAGSVLDWLGDCDARR